MLYDTHCHPNLAKIKNSQQIIQIFRKENPEGFLNIIWTSLKTNIDVLELSKKYDYTFCSVWIHPCDIVESDLKKSILQLEKLLKNNQNKVVAIGECGLDYYWLKKHSNEHCKAGIKQKEVVQKIKKQKKLQKIFFKAQIELAKKYNLPIIIHNRESKNDIFEILKKTNFKNFIFHCYSENIEYAKKLINFSPKCKLSFSWIVTFKNALDIQQTAKNIPLQNILIETDSPYLTPAPFRWKQENEPSFTKYVLEKIVQLRNENKQVIKRQIFENSLKIFWQI